MLKIPTRKVGKAAAFLVSLSLFLSIKIVRKRIGQTTWFAVSAVPLTKLKINSESVHPVFGLLDKLKAET